MLLELAIGDAYGAGFEYVNRQLIRQFNDLSRYEPSCGELLIIPKRGERASSSERPS